MIETADESRLLDFIDKALAIALFAQLVTSERFATLLRLFLSRPEKLFYPLVQNLIFGPLSLFHAGFLPHLILISQETRSCDCLLRRSSRAYHIATQTGKRGNLQSEICN